MVDRRSVRARQRHFTSSNRSTANPPHLRALYVGVCAGLGFGTVTHAQQTTPEPSAAPLEEVLVTGSRIVRRDLEAPSPILTVGAEAFDQTSNIGVEAVLNQYPQFNPGATQFSASNVTPNSADTPGVSTLNMRGLGDGRGLVLVNGRRVQPVNAALAIDANMIPAAMIADVEVISGGAAATYGSDALAGVVNFKLRTDFEGVRLNFQRGFQEAGDGEESRADILVGGNFDDDKGNAVFNVAWASREAAYFAPRDFYMRGYLDPGTESNYPRISFPAFFPTSAAATQPSRAAVDAAFPQLPPGSVPTSSQFYLNPDGQSVFLQTNAVVNGYRGSTEFPYKLRTQLNDTLQEIDTRRLLSSPMTRYSAFGRATYDITSNVSLFAQGTFVNSEIWATGPPTPVTTPAMPRHPTLEPPALRALLDSRPTPNATYRLTEVAKYFPNRTSENETQLFDFTAGLEGRFPNSDWTWEAFTQYGDTTVLTNFVGFLWDERRVDFVSQPNFPFGRGYSRPALTGSNVTLTCTSGFPIFEPYTVDGNGEIQFTNGFELSQDCVDAVAANQTQKNKVKQRIFETNFQGKIAEMKAGELRGAFGATSRWNEAMFRPDPLYTSAVAAGGETDINEIYGEILLPVVPRFELEIGVRRSDFQTVGRTETADTWKTLFNFTATDNLRFRGGLQRAYRTPNVSELFSGPSSNPLIWNEGDPCRTDTLNLWGNVPGNPNRAQVQSLCSALIRAAGVPFGSSDFDTNPNQFPPTTAASGSTVFSVQRQGNPNLAPEIADTKTFGVVWQSEGLDLTVSADYYAITLEGAIDELTFPTVYQQCFNYNGTSNPSYAISNQFCGLIRRMDVTTNTPGYAGQVQGLFYNIGTRDISGIDVDVSWAAELANFGFDRIGGQISVRHSLNYSLKWESTAVPGSPTVDYKGTLQTAQNGLYDYTPFTTFGYRNDRLSISLNWRFLPEIKPNGYADNPLTTARSTSSYNLWGLSGGWDFGGNIRLRAGIDNLFNADPEVVGATPDNNALINTNTGRYDPLGRRGFVGIDVNF
jgi:outer membrane receptor protein involved in Fe transport